QAWCHWPQNVPSMARVAAGAFGFLIFNHAFDGPDLYGALTFFETMPSRPSLQMAFDILNAATVSHIHMTSASVSRPRPLRCVRAAVLAPPEMSSCWGAVRYKDHRSPRRVLRS